MSTLNRRAILDQLILSGQHLDAVALARYFFEHDQSPQALDQLLFTCAQGREFLTLAALLDTYEDQAEYAAVVARRTAQHMHFLGRDDDHLRKMAARLEALNQSGARLQAIRIRYAVGDTAQATEQLTRLLPRLPVGRWPFHLLAAFRRTPEGADFMERAVSQISDERLVGEAAWAMHYLLALTDHECHLDGEDLLITRGADHRRIHASRLPPSVHRLYETYQTLAMRARSFHVQDHSGATSADLILDDIMRAVERREPLSMLRLGDGDGCFLERIEDHPFARFDQVNMARDFWGLTPDHTRLKALSDKMYAAVRAADILGIPDLVRMTRQKANYVDNYGPAREMRGLETILDVALEEEDRLAAKRLVSCHIHQAMQRGGFFPRLCERLSHVHLVSCHAHLPRLIESHYPLKVTLHETPIQYVEEHKLGRRVAGDNISAFEAIVNGLPADMRGTVVLVAAGFYGRLMTRDIRDRGGIALDIGSIANEWMGVGTRMESIELKTLAKTGLGA